MLDIRRATFRAILDGMGTTMQFLTIVLQASVVFILANPTYSVEPFGPDYGFGHMSLASPDLPYEALSLAEEVIGGPANYLEELCGSSGIINIGAVENHFVIKYKWLVRAIWVCCFYVC
ncbi:hypothetical protein EBT31_20925 [bacterium]|nr:hypothetical protein [bacterium]NBX51883.1 hypothetical protein [bacterium]